MRDPSDDTTHRDQRFSASESSPAAGDDIERLVRLAALPATLDQARLARLQAATRPHWERATTDWQRRRPWHRAFEWLSTALGSRGASSTATGRRWAWAGVAATSALAAAVALVVLNPEWRGGLLAPESARLVSMTEDGRRMPPDATEIRPGRTIETGGRGWALELLGSSVAGTSVRLDRGTKARIGLDGHITLLEGAVYVDTHGAATTPLRVTSPRLEVVDIGTQFEVRITADGESVQVREGRVDVTLRADPGTSSMVTPWPVTAGERLDLANAHDAPQQQPTAVSGPLWQWTVDLASAPSFEGRSVSELVAWSARELGVGVRFAEPAAESKAIGTRVFGELAGLGPRDALEAGLAVSSLDHAIDGTTLVIQSRPVTEASSP